MVKENIKIENLSKSYPEGEDRRIVLDDCSFAIEAGKMTSLVGKSGSGKTTILNLLGGLMPADQSHIYLDGEDITTYSENELDDYRAEKIGFIFQDFELIEDFTVEENICLVSDLYQKDRNQKRLNELLQHLELTDLKDHLPSQLSGGEKQRTAIARALYPSPSLVLADEPTGNLDRIRSKQVFDLLRENCFLFDQTILVVTHDLSLAKQADQILVLEDGKVSRYESD